MRESQKSAEAINRAKSGIQTWLDSQQKDGSGPQAVETFHTLRGDDEPGSLIWVCYWDSEERGRKSLQNFSLSRLHASLGEQYQQLVGIWRETFSTPVARIETNYTGLDYLPGLGQLPGTTTAAHNMTAYWGAARDRIPDSAHDLFEKPEAEAETSAPNVTPTGLAQHLTGTNYENMVHIRSGQFWETCDAEEAEAYETLLEPTLETGLQYLWDNREVSGAMGLRYLRNRNLDDESRVLKETCGAGFFANLQSLEDWSKSHPSHVAIFTGAIRHAKRFGETRKFRTWHEVSVLKEGEASFEYLNCLPNTGVMRYISLRDVGGL